MRSEEALKLAREALTLIRNHSSVSMHQIETIEPAIAAIDCALASHAGAAVQQEPIRAALVELIECERARCDAENEGSAHERGLALARLRPRFAKAWEVARAELASPAGAVREGREPLTDAKVGKWLAAALEDPNICDEMKSDIVEWFDERKYDAGIDGSEETQA